MSLFDATPNVRPSDPATSHAAAALNHGSLRARVAHVLAENPHGLTDWELTAAVGMAPEFKPSCGKRRQEAGAVDTGRRRRSPAGQPCIVWALPSTTHENGASDAA